MEKSKYYLIVILTVCALNHASVSYKTAVYEAYVNNTMPVWKQVIDAMEGQESKSNEFFLELINYQYGYIGWCLGNKNNKAARHYLTLADDHLRVLEERGYALSLVHAYKSAFYGYRIGLNKLMAPFMGPKSVEYARTAIELDEHNPYGYIQYGNALYYMPAVFGGSKRAALAYFKKAEELMERDETLTRENWNYLNLLVIIGRAYKETDQLEMAGLYYEKILNIEPRFLWVKNELLRELQEGVK